MSQPLPRLLGEGDGQIPGVPQDQLARAGCLAVGVGGGDELLQSGAVQGQQLLAQIAPGVVWVAALLAALPCSVSAQVEKRVEVTKAYVPSVESAAKLAVVPC